MHNCIVANFSCITAAKDLKEIFLVNCNITSEDLSYLKELTKLKRINDVTFYYLNSEKQFEECIEEISKYLNLSSYGYVGEKLTW